MSRKRAFALLAIVAASMLGLIWVSLTPTVPVAADPAGMGDLALYQTIVSRMQAGSGYYSAAHASLLEQGYGTLSVFNWRLPGLPWLLSLSPSLAWAHVGLIALALVATGVASVLMFKTGGAVQAGLTVALLVLNLALVGSPAALFFAEVPAGLLLLISACCYGLRRPGLGLAAGGAALFVRELAGIYVLVCIGLAWRARRYRELTGWGLILLAFALYFAWHVYNVQLQLGPADRSYPDGWLQWGGLGFILSTAAFSGAFAMQPLWVVAVILPLALLGLLAWPRTGGHAQAGVIVYVLAFAMIGKPFNAYWGFLYTPMLTLGLAWFPAAAADVWRAIGGRSKPVAAASS